MARHGSGEWPKSSGGGGWWRLSDGRAVRGEAKAVEQQSKLDDDWGANRQAFEATLGELHRLGRVEGIDEAKVQVARSLADALDVNPFDGRLWGQYRDALRELTEADEDVDDGLQEALQRLAGAPEVVDEEAAVPEDDRPEGREDG